MEVIFIYLTCDIMRDTFVNTCIRLSTISSRHQLIYQINTLNANPEKWSNTLKQIVGNWATICLSVFDHFMNLALKGLISTKNMPNGGPTRNDLYDTICMTLARFLYDSTNLKRKLENRKLKRINRKGLKRIG